MKKMLLLAALLAAFGCGAQGSKKRVPPLQPDSTLMRPSPSIVVPPDSVHRPMPIYRPDTAKDEQMPVVRPPKKIHHK